MSEYIGLITKKPGVFDSTGLEKITLPEPTIGKGTLFYLEPRLWNTSGVPTSNVPNQSDWAVDLLGSGARYITVVNNVTTGLVERGTKGTMHVAFKRGAGSGSETFVYQNQAIRDYVAANPDHTYFLGVAIRPTRVPHGSYTPSSSHRILGFGQDPTGDAMNLRVNADRTQLAGYPTSADYRIFNKNLPLTDSGSGAAGIVAAAFSKILGTPANSPSIMVHHNGGVDSPGLSYKYYFSRLDDLTVSGRTPEDVYNDMQMKLDQQLSVDGAYRGDVVTDPYSL